jgi:uncharacterized protein YukE
VGNPSPSPSPNPSPTPNPAPSPSPALVVATPKAHHPHVSQSFPSTSGVGSPQWSPVAVESGANLVVDSQTLRGTFAPNLSRMGTTLDAAVTSAGSGAAAAPAIAAIPWGPVQTLSSAVSTAHSAITGYTGGLAVAHDANATNLKTAADIYDDADGTVAHSAQTLQGLQTTWQSNPTSATAKQTTLVMYGGGGDTSANISASQYSDVMRAVDHMPGGQALLNTPSWPQNAKGKTYQVPVSEQNWPHSSADVPASVSLSDLQTLLSPSNIASVQAAATAHGDLANTLGSAANNLQSLGPQIASSWKGSGAVGMVTQVQSMYQTAQGLQQNAAATSQTLHWYGTVLQSFAGGLPQLSQQLQTPGLTASQQNNLTQQYLQQMSPYVQTAYYNLPPSVNSTVLPAKPGSAPGHSTSSSGGAGQLPSTGGLGGVGGTGGVGGSTGGGLPGGSLPGGTTPISVASVPPTGTTTTTVPPVTTSVPSPSVPGTSTVPPVTVPAIPGGSSGSGSTSDDGVGDTGLGDSGVGGDGGLTDFPGVGGLGTTSALGSGNGSGVGADDGVGSGDVGLAGDGVGTPTEGLTGFPGMGGMGGLGGAGTGSTGRVRQAWESEEDGVWDPSADGAFAADAPAFAGDGMIGAADGIGAGGAFGPGGSFAAGGFGSASGSAAAADSTTGADEGMFPFMGGGAGAGGGQDRNGRQRQAWMSEDADVWEPGDNGVPPVIG